MPTETTMGTYTHNTGSGTSIRTQRTWSRSAVVKTAEHAQRRTKPHIWLPPTPFTASDDKIAYGNWTFRDTFGYWQNGVATGSSKYLDDLVTDPISATQKALAEKRALLNLKGQNVNYAQAFAERKQTAGLVAQTAEKFARALPKLRRGNVQGFAHELGFSSKKKFRGVQESWLELQYGWKPLLGDVHGAVTDLWQLDSRSQDRYRATVRGTAHERDRNMYRKSVSGDIWAYGMTSYHRGSRVRLDYYLENPGLAKVASTGFLNPLQLAWELVPWSFVADWFVPVGSYLSALDATTGWKFRGGSCTSRVESATNTWRVYRVGSVLQYLVVWEAGGHSRRFKSVNRQVYASSPVVRFPGIKNPFSLTHMANALALIGQSVR